MMEYKGYHAMIQYSDEGNLLLIEWAQFNDF